MARQKIHFDKKKLSKLTEKLNFYELGIFFSLSQSFLFSDEYYEFLYDAEKKTAFNTDMLKNYLVDNNLYPTIADAIVSKFITENIFAVQPQNSAIYCPLLRTQKQISENKKRNIKSIMRGGHTEPIARTERSRSEVVAKELAQNQTPPELPLEIQEAKQDVLFHMKITKAEAPNKGTESAQEKERKLTAERVLRYLNQQAEKPIGFQVNEGNLKCIKARLKQKFTEEQLKQVIDKKCLDWKSRGYSYANNLNPVTLFRPNNFEKYLNEAIQHFDGLKTAQQHPLNTYIKKWFKNISAHPVQMTYENCEKIKNLANDNILVIKCLRKLENEAELNRKAEVYLSLLEIVENMKKFHKPDNKVIISNAK